MATDSLSLFPQAIQTLLVEVLQQASPHGGWLLNRGQDGLITVLRGIPAEVASREPRPGGKSIAAHTYHICYAITLINRVTHGDEQAFATANWDDSWSIQTVTDIRWQEILDDLDQQAQTWINTVVEPREWDPIMVTGSAASVAHIAYHLGAIHQILLDVR